MTDDIVTRLREDRCCFPECHWLQTDAADEIERLRQLTGRLAGLMMPYALLMTKEEQQEVMKAVRGEKN